jgi:hypothetical protein
VVELLQFVVQVANPAAAEDGLVQHRTARHFLDVLTEVSDRQPPGNRHLALVCHFLSRDEAEQRRLSGAIRAHEADLFAGVELK